MGRLGGPPKPDWARTPADILQPVHRELHPVHREAGIAAVETDLAELIVQLGNDLPSHILVPATHRNRLIARGKPGQAKAILPTR
jgi:hypothetical protein